MTNILLKYYTSLSFGTQYVSFLVMIVFLIFSRLSSESSSENPLYYFLFLTIVTLNLPVVKLQIHSERCQYFTYNKKEMVEDIL